MEAVGAEGERDLALLAVVVDAFDEEFEDAGLVAGGEGVSGLVEGGESRRVTSDSSIRCTRRAASSLSISVMRRSVVRMWSWRTAS